MPKRAVIKVTKEMISRVMAELSRRGSSKGGRARAERLSDDRKREIASMGGKAAKAKREAGK